MKIPDQNIEAEQSLLASLLLNNRAFSHCEFLRPEEFYKTDHQTYFRIMSKMRREKQEVEKAIEYYKKVNW